MPFYEYQCQACGAQVEVMQKISDAPLKKCPECGKSRLTKLISAPVFRLKGGGWYETDFKSDKENKRNLVEAEKSESPASAASESAASTKRARVSRPVAAPMRSKANGSKKPARRAPAARQRRR